MTESVAVSTRPLPAWTVGATEALLALALDPAPSSAWHAQAACRAPQAPMPDTWFPISANETGLVQVRKVCAACPVRLECVAQALRGRERHGIWGGLTVNQLRALRLTLIEIEPNLGPDVHPADECANGHKREPGTACAACKREQGTRQQARRRERRKAARRAGTVTLMASSR